MGFFSSDRLSGNDIAEVVHLVERQFGFKISQSDVIDNRKKGSLSMRGLHVKIYDKTEAPTPTRMAGKFKLLVIRKENDHWKITQTIDAIS